MSKKTVVDSTVTQKVKNYSEFDLNEVSDGDQEMVKIPVGMLHMLLNLMESADQEVHDLNALAEECDLCR